MVHRVGAVTSLYRGFDDGTDARVADAQPRASPTRRSRSRRRRSTMYRRDRDRARRAATSSTTPVDPRDLPPARAACRSSRDRKIRLSPRSWSDNPRKGGADLPLARGRSSTGSATSSPSSATRRRRSSGSATCRRCRRTSSRAAARARHLRHGDRGRRLLERARRGALLRTAGALPRRAAAAREAVKDAGFAFTRREEIPALLDRLVDEYEERQAAIALPSLDEIARRLPRAARPRRVRRRVSARTPSAARARRVGPLVTRRWAPRVAALPRRRGRRLGRSTTSCARRRGSRGQLGIRVADRRLLTASRGQAAFYGSQFTLLAEPWRAAAAPARRRVLPRPSRDARACPSSTRCYATLRAHHEELERVQVSHSELRGARPRDRHRPGEGVPHPDRHRPRRSSRRMTPELRARRARALGLPEAAFVVGSFQKDGVGWGDGRRAEADQGARRARSTRSTRAPRARAGAPRPPLRARRAATSAARARAARASRTVHRQLERYEEVAGSTTRSTPTSSRRGRRAGRRACSSRWPPACPLVTTRVGQAMDLVRHGENGWMVEPEDADGLAAWLVHVAGRPAGARRASPRPALATARREHATPRSSRSGASFFDGFVDGR